SDGLEVRLGIHRNRDPRIVILDGELMNAGLERLSSPLPVQELAGAVSREEDGRVFVVRAQAKAEGPLFIAPIEISVKVGERTQGERIRDRHPGVVELAGHLELVESVPYVQIQALEAQLLWRGNVVLIPSPL